MTAAVQLQLSSGRQEEQQQSWYCSDALTSAWSCCRARALHGHCGPGWAEWAVQRLTDTLILSLICRCLLDKDTTCCDACHCTLTLQLSRLSKKGQSFSTWWSLFYFVFKTGLEFICRPGWPWIHRDLPASPSASPHSAWVSSIIIFLSMSLIFDPSSHPCLWTFTVPR